MKKVFQKYIITVMLLAGVFIMAAEWILLTLDMRRSAVEDGLDRVTQINQVLLLDDALSSGEDEKEEEESRTQDLDESWVEDYIAYSNEIMLAFRRIPSETGEILFAADKETGEIYTHTLDDFTGQNLYGFDIDKKKLEQYQKGFTLTFDDSGSYFCVLKEFNGTLIGRGVSPEVLYRGRTARMVWTLVFWLLMFGVVAYTTDQLVERKVVGAIEDLQREMKRLERGMPEGSIQLEKGTEFYQLFRAVHQMLQGVQNTTGRLARAVQKAKMSMAAYEYYDNMNRVMATDELGYMLGLDTRTVSDLYLEKEQFLEVLEEIKKHPEKEEEQVYSLNRYGRKCWVRMVTVQEEGCVLGLVMDVTREIRTKKNLRKERDCDPLTGLYNRRYFEKYVAEIIEQTDTENAAMAMLDLDYFKGINDSYGHEFGDKYLKQMAGYLEGISDERTLVGRRSGDEFYIFFYGFSSKEEIQKKMHQFYRMVKQSPVYYPDGKIEPMSISAGLNYYDDSYDNMEAFFDRTDKVLYRAKENGKNHFEQ